MKARWLIALIGICPLEWTSLHLLIEFIVQGIMQDIQTQRPTRN
jgi:hypothetical protein